VNDLADTAGPSSVGMHAKAPTEKQPELSFDGARRGGQGGDRCGCLIGQATKAPCGARSKARQKQKKEKSSFCNRYERAREHERFKPGYGIRKGKNGGRNARIISSDYTSRRGVSTPKECKPT